MSEFTHCLKLPDFTLYCRIDEEITTAQTVFAFIFIPGDNHKFPKEYA